MIKKLLALLLVPSLVFAQPSTSKVDLSRVGGTTFTLGQHAESASLSCALPTEQDAAQPSWAGSGPYFGIGGWDAFNTTWNPLAVDPANSALLVSIYGQGVGGGVSPIYTTTTNLASGFTSLQTRSQIYGSDGGVGLASPHVLTSAPGGTTPGLTVRGAGTFAATQSGTWSDRMQDGSGNNLTSTTGTPGTSDRGLTTRSIGFAYDTSGPQQFAIQGNSLYGTQYVQELNSTGAGKAYGNGASGTTVQRVTIANDSTGQVTLASGAAVIANGGVAHDGVDSGNPVKIGGRARTSDFTAVSNDDRVDALFDKLGRLITGLGCLPENQFSGVSAADITNTTSTSVVAAGGAGVKYAVYCITVSNLNSSVSTRVDIQDGTTTKWSCPASAGGGGCAICSPVPLFTGTANTAIQAQCATTGSNTRVSVAGCKVP